MDSFDVRGILLGSLFRPFATVSIQIRRSVQRGGDFNEFCLRLILSFDVACIGDHSWVVHILVRHDLVDCI